MNLIIAYLVCLNLVLCSLTSRLGVLIPLDFPFSYLIKYGLRASIALSFLLSCMFLLIHRPKLLLRSGILYAVILMHSFAHLFWPSLRWDVPIQDYLLSDSTSSMYSFVSGKLYLQNFFLFLLPSFVVLSEFKNLGSRFYAIFITALLCALLPNVFIAYVQGMKDYFFLAQGSGTAIYIQRAVGLLEDGGASAIYFALLVSGFFSVLLFTHKTWMGSSFKTLIFVLTFIAGTMTGGRAFYICFFGAALCLLFLYFVHRRGMKSLVFTLGLLSVFIFSLKFAPERLSKSFSFLNTEIVDHWKDPNFIGDSLVQIDRVRAVHIKAMYKAFIEHPLKGTGFGSFYSNLFEHKDWAKDRGGYFFADPPELYFMILSEWGLAGIICLFFLLLLTRHKVLNVFQNRYDSKLSSINYFMLGLVLALLISFWIGVHYIFNSFSVLAGFGFAWLLLQDGRRGLKFLSPNKIFYSFVVCLLAGTLYQIYTAPRSPAFRWDARGKAQVPLSLDLPEDYKIDKEGQWLSSGAELLLDKDELSFIVKRPVDLYPVHIDVVLYDQAGLEKFRIQKSVDANSENTITLNFDKDFINSCKENMRSDHFCSYRIFTKPKWAYKSRKPGVFVLML